VKTICTWIFFLFGAFAYAAQPNPEQAYSTVTEELRHSIAGISPRISVVRQTNWSIIFIRENCEPFSNKEKYSGSGLSDQRELPKRTGYEISVTFSSGAVPWALSRTPNPDFSKSEERKASGFDFYQTFTATTLPEAGWSFHINCYYGSKANTQRLAQVYSTIQTNLISYFTRNPIQ
jgi:hypothetical protein